MDGVVTMFPENQVPKVTGTEANPKPGVIGTDGVRPEDTPVRETHQEDYHPMVVVGFRPVPVSRMSARDIKPQENGETGKDPGQGTGRR